MKIRTRLLSAALLFHENNILLIEKPASVWQQQTEPFYSIIGGHMEPAEINDPLEACYREIEEETGLGRKDISELQLRYVLMRLKKDEIRVQYIYAGRTKHNRVVDSAEGALQWHRTDRLAGLRFSFMLRSVLDHYLTDPHRDNIMTGMLSVSPEGLPVVHWNELLDPLVF